MSRGRELLVGFVIIIAIVVAVVGTLWLQGSGWGSGATFVEVLLRDVAQLSEGNPVKFRGVQIGRVSTISVEPDGQAVRVRLQLDQEVVLPPDAVVLLSPESFFGDWQAEIAQRQRFPAFDFYDVPEGSRERTPPVLGGYALPELSRLTASAEQISDNVAELSERLEVAFNEETAANLAQAITNLEAITRDVRDFVERESETATDLTQAADSALAEITEASRSARVSFDRIEALLVDNQVDSIVTNVRRATASIERISENLAESSGGMSSTLEQADSAFARLDRLTAQIERGEGALGRLLTDSTLAMRAENVLGELDLLLQDLRENPRRYVRLSIF